MTSHRPNQRKMGLKQHLLISIPLGCLTRNHTAPIIHKRNGVRCRHYEFHAPEACSKLRASLRTVFVFDRHGGNSTDKVCRQSLYEQCERSFGRYTLRNISSNNTPETKLTKLPLRFSPSPKGFCWPGPDHASRTKFLVTIPSASTGVSDHCPCQLKYVYFFKETQGHRGGKNSRI